METQNLTSQEDHETHQNPSKFCVKKTQNKVAFQHANTDIFVTCQVLRYFNYAQLVLGSMDTTNQPNMEHEEKYKQKEYQCDCSTEKNTFQTTKNLHILLRASCNSRSC
jgi:hypothetical protein